MSFAEKFIRWVMLCVTTVQYTLCSNGKCVGPIYTKWGLRQGDPLSPYLFLLCVKGLSNALSNSAAVGNLYGCKISPTAPEIMHLLFADVNFLFFKATREEASTVKQVLKTYVELSGQAVNF